MELDHFFNYI